MHLIGHEARKLTNTTEYDYQRRVIVDLKSIKQNITQAFFGYGCSVFTNCDFSYIYNTGSRTSWGLKKKVNEKLLNIEYFNTHNIKIKKVFMNPMSDILFCLTNDDKIYGIGNDEHGQMGLGNNEHRKGPQLISFLSNSNLIDVQSGEYCSIALFTSDHKTANIIISYWIRLYNLPNDIASLITIFSKINIVYATDTGFCGEDGHSVFPADLESIIHLHGKKLML